MNVWELGKGISVKSFSKIKLAWNIVSFAIKYNAFKPNFIKLFHFTNHQIALPHPILKLTSIHQRGSCRYTIIPSSRLLVEYSHLTSKVSSKYNVFFSLLLKFMYIFELLTGSGCRHETLGSAPHWRSTPATSACLPLTAAWRAVSLLLLQYAFRCRGLKWHSFFPAELKLPGPCISGPTRLRLSRAMMEMMPSEIRLLVGLRISPAAFSCSSSPWSPSFTACTDIDVRIWNVECVADSS